ncbi:MAG: porin [Bacteroidaceae bacterium]|nr:porin [Bacteroidaceae bacterium]
MTTSLPSFSAGAWAKGLLLLSLLALPFSLQAQEEEDTENGVVSVAGKKGFTIESKTGDFVFKPYLMVQATGNFNYYDDEGLDKAYNQDNVANSGFSIPYAIIGFTGKALGKVSYNLSINAAGSGSSVLQQAWFDVKFKEGLAVRVGKFKTPQSHAFQTTLGSTLLPQLPTSLTAPVILPHSLNAVTPNIATGWDLGVSVHGLLGGKFGYEVGVFNGTSGSTNAATKTFSDDWHIPSLLYAGRFTYMPRGVMPSTQGDPSRLHENKMLFGLSLSENVESENESTNDFRAGLEFAWLKGRWYFGAEAYYMNVSFTDRQKIDDSYNYWGGYVQAGYFVTDRVQLAARYDLMDRNGTGKDGMLNMPAVGVNWFIPGCNLKLQGMYQYIGRTGHKTQLDRDNDDLGQPMHTAKILLQYTF